MFLDRGTKKITAGTSPLKTKYRRSAVALNRFTNASWSTFRGLQVKFDRPRQILLRLQTKQVGPNWPIGESMAYEGRTPHGYLPR